MTQSITFNAPWGMPLKLITGFCVLLLVGIAAIGVLTDPEGASSGFLA
jgi:hypothetical protein